MHLKTVSRSARFMCLFSCTGHNQLACSAMDPLFSITPLKARELASTHMVMSYLFTHQLPQDGSVLDVFEIISTSIQCRKGSCTSLSHSIVTALFASQMQLQHRASQTLVSAQSIFPTGKRCSDKSSPSHHHCSLLWSTQICKPNTRVPFLSCWSIQIA